jgi:hypothetical protein
LLGGLSLGGATKGQRVASGPAAATILSERTMATKNSDRSTAAIMDLRVRQ